MRRSPRICILFSMLAGFGGVVAAQTGIEYGINSARAATMAAGAKGVSKSVRGVAKTLEKTVKAAEQAPATSEAPRRAPRIIGPVAPVAEAEQEAPAPVVPARTYEDPNNIKAGMGGTELAQRFGPPSLEVNGGTNRRILTYAGKDGVFQLEMQDEKVAAISPMKRQQSALVLPR